MAAPVRWNDVTALFGGTFDPPHVGHRQAAEGLLHLPGVGNIVVVPSGTPPLRGPARSSAEDRLALARLGFSGIPRLEVSPYEIESATPDRTNYTWHTVEHFLPRVNGLACVIGTDQLRQLDRWHGFPELLRLCHWIVLERKSASPSPGTDPREVLLQWKASGLVTPVASGTGSPGDSTYAVRSASTVIQIVPTPAPALSATAIRETIALTGHPPAASLHPQVEEYCLRHHLYGMRTQNDE